MNIKKTFLTFGAVMVFGLSTAFGINSNNISKINAANGPEITTDTILYNFFDAAKTGASSNSGVGIDDFNDHLEKTVDSIDGTKIITKLDGDKKYLGRFKGIGLSSNKVKGVLTLTLNEAIKINSLTVYGTKDDSEEAKNDLNIKCGGESYKLNIEKDETQLNAYTDASSITKTFENPNNSIEIYNGIKSKNGFVAIEMKVTVNVPSMLSQAGQTWGNNFLDTLSNECGAGGSAEYNLSKTTWDALKTSYADVLAEDKALFKSATANAKGNVEQKVASLYDYCRSKYDFARDTNETFINRTNVVKAVDNALETSDNGTILLVSLSIAALAVIGVSIIFARRSYLKNK